MNITINSEQSTVDNGATLLTVAQNHKLPATGIAMAVNNEMVPRTEWENTTLKEGDDIIIIRAVCGG